MSTQTDAPDKPWRFKDHKKQIITGIVVTLIITTGTFVWNQVSSGSRELLARSEIKKTLEKYAGDINSNSFDATRYFASTVPVFFEDRDRTPRLINIFWQEHFLNLFQNYHARFDYESLQVHCSDDCYTASLLLYSDYYNIKKRSQTTNEKSRYDLKFDKEFRIVEITQVVGENVEVK